MNSDKEITMHKYSLFKSITAAFLLFLAPFALMAQDVSELAGQPTPININSADAQAIAETLVGVGMVRAKEIVAYREMFGQFQSLEELLEVQGIGTATLDKNKHLISLSSD
jgi:competence protein ComEA